MEERARTFRLLPSPGRTSSRHSSRPVMSEFASYSDARLIAAATTGQTRAFDELSRRYAPRLFKFCRALTSDVESAEDLKQETLLRAWRSLHTFDAGAEMWPWLATIARRPNPHS